MFKYSLIAIVAMVLFAVPAQAAGFDFEEFRANGQIEPLDIDFAMQGEVTKINHDLKHKINGVAAMSGAMSMMPFVDNAVTMGAGISGNELGFAVGYAKKMNEKGVKAKFGIAVDTDGGSMAGAGVAIPLN